MLAQILDLLCHLVNYGYYSHQKDVDETLTVVIKLLNGEDVNSPDLVEYNYNQLPLYTNNWIGDKKDQSQVKIEGNSAVFAVKKK